MAMTKGYLEERIRMTKVEIEAKQNDLAEYEAQLAMIVELGADKYDDETVISFSKQWGQTSGTVYHYAAVKSGGMWHVSGARRLALNAMNWEQLLRFIGQRENEMPTIYVATEWGIL